MDDSQPNSLPVRPDHDVVSLSKYLTTSFFQYQKHSGLAGAINRFYIAACSFGVQDVLHADIDQMLRELQGVASQHGESILTPVGVNDMANGSFQRALAQATIESAQHAVRVARVALLHTAFENYLQRIARLAIIRNRDKAKEWISLRKVDFKTATSMSTDDIINCVCEKGLDELRKSSMIEKWDVIIRFLDYPTKLNSAPEFKFSRNMLAEFDEVRHDAVHHDGTKLRSFDLDEFELQLGRAAWVLAFHTATQCGIFILSNMPSSTGG